MSMRVIGPKLTDRDYGRRLYVSGKEYQTQMREVTDKAKLGQKPFHLSELKKPYATDSYEEMEYNFSWPGGIKIGFDYPFIIRPENEEEETTSQYSSRLKWITEPPDIVEAGHWYLMEVANASRVKQLRRAGGVIRADIQYLLPQFNIRKASADAKGMEVEQRFATISNSAFANFMRFGQRSIRFVYEWAKTGSQRFLYLMSNLWDGREGATVVESATQAKLIVGDDAAGVYEVRVTDGKTMLKKVTRIGQMSWKVEPPDTITAGDPAFNCAVENEIGTIIWELSGIDESYYTLSEYGDNIDVEIHSDCPEGTLTITVRDSKDSPYSGREWSHLEHETEITELDIDFFLDDYSLTSILAGDPVLYENIIVTDTGKSEYSFNAGSVSSMKGTLADRPVTTFWYEKYYYVGEELITGIWSYTRYYEWTGSYWELTLQTQTVENWQQIHWEGNYHRWYYLYDGVGTIYPTETMDGTVRSMLYLNKTLVLEITEIFDLLDNTGYYVTDVRQMYIDSDNYLLALELTYSPDNTVSYWIWGRFKGTDFYEEVETKVTIIKYGTGTPV